MTLVIHRDTFVQSYVENHNFIDGSPWDSEIGTVDITFGGERFAVEARRWISGSEAAFVPSKRGIQLQGFVGRYRTGKKVWRATVYSFEDGRVGAIFGRDDRSGRCQKLDGISYSPEAWKTAAR